MAGGCPKIYELLTWKLQKGINLSLLDMIVMFDSFNGANYLDTTEGKFNLISFSTAHDKKYFLALCDCFTAQSIATLTWR